MSTLVCITLPLPFTSLLYYLQRFSISKSSFRPSFSLIQNLHLIFRSSSCCCSEFPNPQILHPVLHLLLWSRQNMYCLLPQEGLFPRCIPVWCLFSVFQCFACSYLDCTRWEGLWPALNLTKIKQYATWIIYIFKSFPLLFIAHSLYQISPSRPPPETSQSLFSLVLLSHWHILSYINSCLNIVIFL